MIRCECSDKGCKAHEGIPSCESVYTVALYRIDMQDETGTLFCDSCAEDAMDSGLFTTCEVESTFEVYCPICDGNGVYLGALGKREYFRCESCGMEFS